MANLKIKFTDQDERYIKENYLDKTYKEIANILGYTESQIKTKAISLNLRKKRQINKDYFESIDSSEKAYYLGLIYADGWIQYNLEKHNYEFGIQLQLKDRYIIDNLNTILGGNNYMKVLESHISIINNKQYKTGEMCYLRVYSKKIVSDLQMHGIAENKTQKDVFPIIDDYLFFDFLRGYIDGDGCFYINKNHVYMHITSASIVALKYLQSRLNYFGINTKVYTEKERKHRLMCVNTAEMIKLINLLYKNEDCICLKRKYDIVKDLIGLAA